MRHILHKFTEHCLPIVLTGFITVCLCAWAFISVPVTAAQQRSEAESSGTRLNGAEIRIDQLREKTSDLKTDVADLKIRIGVLEQSSAAFKSALGTIGGLGGLALVLQIVMIALGRKPKGGPLIGG